MIGAAPQEELIGQVLADRYRVDELIGEGAMGRVYRAEHVLMRKQVAIKVLHPELMTVPEVIARFEREARAAAHIEHAHVAAATDFGKLDNGCIYLVLEFVEGMPLSEAIADGPLPLRRVLKIASQIASALEAAHMRGIVHRDLKPDNLLIEKVAHESDDDFIKVLDFGIAKAPPDPNDDGKPITQIGMVYGTPEYMAPEQALGQDVDARADLYALGVVMYEMLTGRRPYLGPAVALLGQQLSNPLPKMSQVANVRVPAAVEQFVVELLATDVKKRIQSSHEAHEQLTALSEALASGRLAGQADRASNLLSISFDEVTRGLGQVTESLPQPVQRVVRSRMSRIAVLSLAFGAVGVVAAILAVGAFVENEPSPPVPSTAELVELPPPVLDVPQEIVELPTLLEEARGGGISSLEELAKEYPAEGAVRAELALAQAKAKHYVDAVDSARIALALDPKLNENAKVAGALFRAAQSSKASSSAFRLLKGPMGPAGVGIIYDLAQTKGLSRRVRKQAQTLLQSPELRQQAPPPLLLLLDIESTKDCRAMAEIVERSISVGDRRVLAKLKDLQSPQGCGVGKKEDCYPCLRDNNHIETALSTIEQRVSTYEEATKSASENKEK